MMKHIIAALMLCWISAGFAVAAAPSYKELAKLPVIRFGETVPDNKDYILLFSAGQTVTIAISIEGSLFDKTANTELMVTPAKDIMVYRDWASLDGYKWIPRGELIKSDVLVKIPGYNHPQPGILKVRMDLAGVK
jgi:hypothetical protein